MTFFLIHASFDSWIKLQSANGKSNFKKILKKKLRDSVIHPPSVPSSLTGHFRTSRKSSQFNCLHITQSAFLTLTTFTCFLMYNVDFLNSSCSVPQQEFQVSRRISRVALGWRCLSSVPHSGADWNMNNRWLVDAEINGHQRESYSLRWSRYFYFDTCGFEWHFPSTSGYIFTSKMKRTYICVLLGMNPYIWRSYN